jgi:O-antigen/teichoic acid export membrane protein
VAGGLFTSLVYTGGSFFLIPGLKHKFHLSKKHTFEIVGFGKWIFLSSIIFFLSVNYDRLYFAKVIPIEVLGIYGIARNIADLVVSLVGRLGSNVVFPFIASHSQTPRATLHRQLAWPRAAFLLFVAVGLSILVATADLAIKLLYDQRYAAATWMLPVLIVGSWFSVLGRVNESMLLGLGKPSYGTLANTAKFAFLLIGLPLSVAAGGLLGGVLVVALVDLPRYVPILIGQRRERLSYGMQDLQITIAMFVMIGLLEFLRWKLGFGTSFDSLPALEFK